MTLPIAPPAYSVDDQRRTRAAIERADKQNRKLRQDIEITSERLILSSPNGSRWVLTVSNAGALSAVAL